MTESVNNGRKMDTKCNQEARALREELHVKKGKKIPKAKLKKAEKAKGKLGKRARLAETLGKLRKKKGK